MIGQQLGSLRVELNLLRNTNIYLREIVMVEARPQNLTIHDDVLVLQLLLRSKHEPSGVELLHLAVDSLVRFDTLLFRLLMVSSNSAM
mgnify:CR=1 FL=1